MKEKELVAILKQIKKDYTGSIFLNASSLVSYISDLSGPYEFTNECKLIKVAYREAANEITGLIHAMDEHIKDLSSYIKSVADTLTYAFMPEENILFIVTVLLSCFGFDYKEYDRKLKFYYPKIHSEEFKNVLIKLNNRYGNDIWKDCKILSNFILDMNPTLSAENQLVKRVYVTAAEDLRVLIRELVKQKNCNENIVKLQKKLQQDFIAAEYINVFAEVISGVFGQEYHQRISSKSITERIPVDGQAVLTQNHQAQRPEDSEHADISEKTTETKSRIKAAGGIVILVVLIIGTIIFAGRRKQTDDEQDPEDVQMTASISEMTEDDLGFYDEEDSEEDETSLMPRMVDSPEIETMDHTIYGENVTDLNNYALFKYFTLTYGFPLKLYKEVEHISSFLKECYSFSGDEGSSMIYSSDLIEYRYKGADFREEQTRKYAEEMTDVELISYEDGDESTQFILSAKEGTLDVHIAVHYQKGNCKSIILKIPEATDKEDAMIKGYYLNTIFSLAEILDQEETGMQLCTYDEYVAEY